MIRRELWAIVDDERGQYDERTKMAALKELADLEFKGLHAAQSLGLAYKHPVKVEQTIEERAPKTVKRVRHLLLTGQLNALYDVMNDGVDFDSKYGAPRD